MQTLLLGIDKISTLVGQAASWLIVGLTLMISYEVFSRYALGTPHAWVFDASNMLYGALFMLGGAYTLAKRGHVRGDILYGFLQPRAQAAIDLVLYLLFFFPGVIALAWAGLDFFQVSLAQNEHSSIAADGPPIYPFKAVIPVAGALLLLQGVAEVIRCVLCLMDGDWPRREEDVEEVDVDKLKQMVGKEVLANAADISADTSAVRAPGTKTSALESNPR
ncbi:TRAP transporter small permease subunit [Cupriavidus plantarum]|uniref:TRAP transporter small permease subunit n=1 Tax=Cupriavidus plantarum TaxID=942865 RepID=UPI000EB27132|nr:TRAP transporter small permease subunit [Cupriavidus plantarum]RLK36152.1 TRAP-type mannitol/chloroaromatic compound transport system permease small subunit [Cupriavidus plantarum]